MAGYGRETTDAYGNPNPTHGQVDEFGDPIIRNTYDAYGNPITHPSQKDEFGNPITHPTGQHQTGTTGAYGTHGQQQTGTTGAYGSTGTHAPGSGVGMHGTGTGATIGTETGIGQQQRGGLRRSGSSSSSSSSEDDGQGGRRKKGLKEKIREKLPGGRKKTDQGYTTTPGGTTVVGGKTDQGYTTTPGGTTVVGGTTTGTGGYAGQTEQSHEKKGMMEKIKEKLPGHKQGPSAT